MRSRHLFGQAMGLVALLIAVGCDFALDPEDVEDVSVQCERGPAELKRGDTFKVVVWNLQFGAGRKHQFFYDGGDAVRVPEADTEAAVAEIAQALKDIGADIALLQEVDRGSDRTQQTDQLMAYLDASEPACWASTPYHQVAYLPYPGPTFLGKVDMHLSTLSRFQIATSKRHQLALLDEPGWRQAMNLKRAILETTVPLADGGELRLGNTHLSAFSGGDGTLEKQVAQLDDWMGHGALFVLGGDFNMLPPGDDPSRLTTERDLYADDVNPIEAILPERSIATADPLDKFARTYLPFGEDVPDRKIDYVVLGDDLEVLSARVLGRYRHLSDHLPILVEFRIRSGEEPELEDDADEEPPAGARPRIDGAPGADGKRGKGKGKAGKMKGKVPRGGAKGDPG